MFKRNVESRPDYIGYGTLLYSHDKEPKQVVELEDGSVIVGVDAWRLLNAHDYPSYSLTCFNSMEEARRKYKFRKPDHRTYYVFRKENYE